MEEKVRHRSLSNCPSGGDREGRPRVPTIIAFHSVFCN